MINMEKDEDIKFTKIDDELKDSAIIKQMVATIDSISIGLNDMFDKVDEYDPRFQKKRPFIYQVSMGNGIGITINTLIDWDDSINDIQEAILNNTEKLFQKQCFSVVNINNLTKKKNNDKDVSYG